MKSDVIARVKLRSTTPGVERFDIWDDDDVAYVGVLNFKFEVLEYLKGSGGSELVAFAYNWDSSTRYDKESAGKLANNLLADRDTSWDDREAIVLLRSDHPWMDDLPQAGRYLFDAILAPYYVDRYTIVSPHNKRWLPATSAGGESGSSGTGTQRFLLDQPGAAASQSGGTPTITLADLKTRIANLEKEASGGDGSQEYRDCIYYKYRWEREVRYMKDSLGGNYFYIRHDNAIDSGLPAGVRVYTVQHAGLYLAEGGETEPSNFGEFRLVGGDEGLFDVRWPGMVYTVRPLPAREYKFYFSERANRYIICDAHP